MKIKIIVTLLLLLLAISVQGQKTQDSPLPFSVVEEDISPLLELNDEDLQRALSNRLKQNPRWKALIEQKRMSVGLVDLSNPLQPRFASINGNYMMYAASLPKIAVLLAAMDAIEKGELQSTPEIRTDLMLMISKSNNQASTRMIDRVGFEKIEDVLTDPELKLYDEDMGGGLWVGKRYASQGKRNPDPLKGLSHAGTVNQICRFYYLLAYGQLVSEEKSKEMLGYLKDPKLHHKFVNTLDRVAPRATIYRKSGSWKTYHSDSILVTGPEWRQYILVALIDDTDGENIIRKLVVPVEKVLHTGR